MSEARKGRRSVAGGPHDPTIKYTKVTLRGKECRLVFDLNALADAEVLSGGKVNLAHGLANFLLTGAEGTGYLFSLNELRMLLFAAMRKAHPDITLEGAGELIRITNMVDVQNALLTTYAASMDEDIVKKSEGESAPPEQANA